MKGGGLEVVGSAMVGDEMVVLTRSGNVVTWLHQQRQQMHGLPFWRLLSRYEKGEEGQDVAFHQLGVQM